MKKLVSIIIAVMVVVGGGAFFGGMKYAESRNSANRFAKGGNLQDLQNLSLEERQQRLQDLGANGGGFRGGMGMGGQRTGSGFTAGEIISKDDKSVTIKLQDGGSKIIFLSDSTAISKTVDNRDDLTVGKQVMVSGTANSDGSVTAQLIQLRSTITLTP